MLKFIFFRWFVKLLLYFIDFKHPNESFLLDWIYFHQIGRSNLNKYYILINLWKQNLIPLPLLLLYKTFDIRKLPLILFQLHRIVKYRLHYEMAFVGKLWDHCLILEVNKVNVKVFCLNTDKWEFVIEVVKAKVEDFMVIK